MILYQVFNVGKSGYTSLSLEEKRYAKLRRNFEINVNTDNTFTVWATAVMEAAVNREGYLHKTFPGIRFVGNKTGGCILEEKGKIIEVTVTKNQISCDQKDADKYILFALLHPNFEIS